MKAVNAYVRVSRNIYIVIVASSFPSGHKCSIRRSIQKAGRGVSVQWRSGVLVCYQVCQTMKVFVTLEVGLVYGPAHVPIDPGGT